MKRAKEQARRGRSFRKGLLRRALALVSYWQGKQLYIENYLTRRKIAASLETAAILDFFSTWKREEAAFQRWPEYTERSLRHAIRRLVEATFLQRFTDLDAGERTRERALQGWESWNPHASFFHLQTKDTYRERISVETIRWTEELLRRERIPTPTKKYPGVRVIPLEPADYTREFPRVLRERRTWRKFGREPMSKEITGRLLHLSFGVQEWLKTPGGERFALKTSPSGGALHPGEVYLLARNLEGIPAGIYHYDAVEHGLQGLRRGTSGGEIQKLLAGQWWFRDAAMVVFLTAVFSRTQWKYKYARAYRAVLAEAGHLCQTFCLTATWLGLAPFCTMALADTRIEKALGVDGISESVIYAMGAGCKPKR